MKYRLSARLPIQWRFVLANAILVVIPSVAYAQDAPNVGGIAKLIRWGGVAASVPIILGMMFLIRLVENASNKLSIRFSSRRPTIQKVQTSIRFAL
jgi:hypothetical protein